MQRIRLWKGSDDACVKLEGVRRSILHHADAGYQYLHDTTIAAFQGKLYCAWYNSARGEMAGHTIVRGCVSRDKGESWSKPFVLSEDVTGARLRVPAQLVVLGGALYAYVTEMSGFDLCEDCLVLRMDGERFREIGRIGTPMIINCAPQRLPDGRWIAPCRISHAPGCMPQTPGMLLIEEAHPDRPVILRMPGDWPTEPQRIPETSIVRLGSLVYLIVRSQEGPFIAFVSADCERFEGPYALDIPFEASKAYGGALPDGRAYLLYNERTETHKRTRLMLAVARPGADAFCDRAALFDGEEASLGAASWHYPSATTLDDALYVSCTAKLYPDAERHAALAVVPFGQLP